MTNEEKCAAFLLIAISKKAFVIRGNPTPITRRHINENYNNVSKAKIGCIYFSAQRGFLDVFEEAGGLLFTGQEITVFKGYFLLAFYGGRNFNI